jgi:hypothetical protein
MWPETSGMIVANLYCRTGWLVRWSGEVVCKGCAEKAFISQGSTGEYIGDRGEKVFDCGGRITTFP